MTEHVACRPATPSDVGFLADVVIEATADQGRLPADLDLAEYRAGYMEWTAEHVHGEVDGSSTFVIEVDGQQAGRLRVVQNSECLELAGIQLLPRFQSQGIGSHIVRSLVERAVSSGRRFELTVDKDNPRARALYERLGLVEESGSDDKHLMVWPPHVR